MYNSKDYCLDGENWLPIKEYEGIYEASDFGRIRTVEGKETHSTRHGIRTWKPRILKPKGETYKTGYRVTLWKEKAYSDFLVARLVAITFLGDPPGERNTVNHIDGNRFNNHISNLEWLSLADNIRHAFETGLMPSCKKTVVHYKQTQHEFNTMSKASTFIGRSKSYISNRLKNGKDIYHADGTVVKVEI